MRWPIPGDAKLEDWHEIPSTVFRWVWCNNGIGISSDFPSSLWNHDFTYFVFTLSELNDVIKSLDIETRKL